MSGELEAVRLNVETPRSNIANALQIVESIDLYHQSHQEIADQLLAISNRLFRALEGLK